MRASSLGLAVIFVLSTPIASRAQSAGPSLPIPRSPGVPYASLCYDGLKVGSAIGAHLRISLRAAQKQLVLAGPKRLETYDLSDAAACPTSAPGTEVYYLAIQSPKGPQDGYFFARVQGDAFHLFNSRAEVPVPAQSCLRKVVPTAVPEGARGPLFRQVLLDHLERLIPEIATLPVPTEARTIFADVDPSNPLLRLSDTLEMCSYIEDGEFHALVLRAQLELLRRRRGSAAQ